MKNISGNLFLQYLISYAIVLGLPLIVLGYVTQFYFIDSYTQDTLKKNMKIPQQIQVAVDMQIEQLNNFSNQVAFNKYFSQDYVDDHVMAALDIMDSLRKFKVANEFVEVVLYSQNEASLYYSPSSTYDTKILFSAIYPYTGLSYNQFLSLPATIIAPTWIEDTQITLFQGNQTRFSSYLSPVRSLDMGTDKKMLMFLIRRESFEKIIGATTVNNIYCIITNTQGKTIYSSLPDNIDVSTTEAIHSVAGLEDSVWKSSDIDGWPVYISQVKSSSTDLTYLTIMPVATMLEEVQKIQSLYSIVLTILVTIGFLLIVFLSKYNYWPIRRFLDFVGKLGMEKPLDLGSVEAAQHAIEDMNKVSIIHRQEHLLLNLLKGINADLVTYAAAGLQFPGPYYRVMFLNIQSIIPAHNGNIYQKIQQLVDNRLCAYIVEYVEQSSFILITSEPNQDNQNLLDTVKGLLSDLSQSGIGSDLSIGSVYSSTELLHQSFSEAKTAFASRSFKVPGDIVQYNTLPSENISGMQYPTSDLCALSNAIEQNNSVLVKLTISEILRQVSLLSDNAFTARCICYDTINRILQSMDTKNTGWFSQSCADILSNLPFDSVTDLTVIIHALCKKIELETRQGIRSDKSMSIFDAITYIDSCFFDQNFSIKRLVSEMNMSVSNFSHQFRTHTGQTVTEYINNLRINYAKSLMNSGDRTINEIAEKVGYYHTSSFIRMFKQTESITPGEYLETQNRRIATK